MPQPNDTERASSSKGWIHDNAVYLYWSTSHFKPIANGHSTRVPPVFTEITEAMESFPDEASMSLLRRLGFRCVTLYRDRFLKPSADRTERALGEEPRLVKVLRTTGGYEIVRRTAHVWVEVFDAARRWVAFDPTPPTEEAAEVPGGGLLSTGIDSLLGDCRRAL